MLWYLKQLLPLTYVSTFGEGGYRFVTVWKMWFGHQYNIRKWKVVD